MRGFQLENSRSHDIHLLNLLLNCDKVSMMNSNAIQAVAWCDVVAQLTRQAEVAYFCAHIPHCELAEPRTPTVVDPTAH